MGGECANQGGYVDEGVLVSLLQFLELSGELGVILNPCHKGKITPSDYSVNVMSSVAVLSCEQLPSLSGWRLESGSCGVCSDYVDDPVDLRARPGVHSTLGRVAPRRDPHGSAGRGRPSVSRRDASRMREHLAHRYFDTDHAIVQDVVETEIDPLLQAVRLLLERVDLADDS